LISIVLVSSSATAAPMTPLRLPTPSSDIVQAKCVKRAVGNCVPVVGGRCKTEKICTYGAEPAPGPRAPARLRIN
jgi:hypothetical protein